MEIKGYTLHGDYYLADDIIPNKSWKEACEMKKEITLPNGKTVIARVLSKEELETIPEEERGTGSKWYWTSTLLPPYACNYAWLVYNNGDFNLYIKITYSSDGGGARLGFKNPF